MSTAWFLLALGFLLALLPGGHHYSWATSSSQAEKSHSAQTVVSSQVGVSSTSIKTTAALRSGSSIPPFSRSSLCWPHCDGVGLEPGLALQRLLADPQHGGNLLLGLWKTLGDRHGPHLLLPTQEEKATERPQLELLASLGRSFTMGEEPTQQTQAVPEPQAQGSWQRKTSESRKGERQRKRQGQYGGACVEAAIATSGKWCDILDKPDISVRTGISHIDLDDQASRGRSSTRHPGLCPCLQQAA